MNNFALASVPVFFLCACGGGGGSEATPAGNVTLLSQDAIIDLGYHIIDEFGAAPTTTNMPNTGTVSYEGVGAGAGGTFATDPSIILANATSVYQVAASMNFSSNTFSGEAFNFKSATPGYTITGTVDANGTVTGNTFSGTYSGTLRESYGGTSANVLHAGSFDGEFRGVNADAAVAVGTGTASAPGYGSQPVSTYWGILRQ